MCINCIYSMPKLLSPIYLDSFRMNGEEKKNETFFYPHVSFFIIRRELFLLASLLYHVPFTFFLFCFSSFSRSYISLKMCNNNINSSLVCIYCCCCLGRYCSYFSVYALGACVRSCWLTGCCVLYSSLLCSIAGFEREKTIVPTLFSLDNCAEHRNTHT